MVELTDEFPHDVVTCRCGRQWDRNVYSQCGDCMADLWNLDQLAATPTKSQPACADGGKTYLERDAAQMSGLDVLVCGRRLSLGQGQTLLLGREDECDTGDVFRDAKNVSRRHALLRFDGERLFVTDVGSANGTYVSGQQLPANTEYELRPGQALRLASNVPVDVKWEN